MKFARLIILALLGCLLPATAQSASGSRTILILDASGSMWGQINGSTKIEIAQSTAEDLIKNRPKDLQMGLMAYGHRRKGDCDDIDLIVPPGSETTAKLLAALDQLVPKGKTPIFKSVLQAAEALRYTEKAASVILVSDGIETCGGDLAALGKLLAEKGIDFKTHIIGFAMKDSDTVALRGLAKATGGIYADAGDAGSLKVALQTAVVAATKPVTSLSLVPLDQDGKSILKNGVGFTISKSKTDETALFKGAGGQWNTELDPGTYHVTATFGDHTLEAQITAEKGRNTTHTFTFSAPVLTLQAVLKEGGEPLTDSVSWGVWGQPNAEGKRQQIAFSFHATARLRLGPGDYRITARRGSAKVARDISFAKEPMTVSLIFEAGTLKASATLKEGDEPLTDGLSWDVLGDPNSEGKRPQIAYSFHAQPKFTLPAGSYLLQVKKGSSTVSGQIEVKAGELTSHQLVMGSGTVVANAVMSSGVEAHTGRGLSWAVLGDPNSEGKRPKIAYSFHAAPRFTLPAGSYLLQVERGSASASQDIEVKPGETINVTLNFNAAILKATAVLTEGGDPMVDPQMSWRVLGPPNAEGKRQQFAYEIKARPSFSLPVGKYTLTVERGDASAQQEVEVVAGKFNTATVNLNAGLLKVTLTDAAGTPIASKASWSVLGPPNAEGKRKKIAYSFDKVPTFVLPAGKVTLKAEFDDKTAEAPADVTPGRLTEFTLKVAE